jgi:hypothetical protein
VSGITRIAAGGDHTLALRSDAAVLAWGSNGLGQLGDGTQQGRSIAGAVSALTGVREISAGYYFSTALKTDGTVWSWGYNYGGQLGQGLNDVTVATTPAQIAGLPPIQSISSGGSHTLAVTTTGTVWGWGATARANSATAARSIAMRPSRSRTLGHHRCRRRRDAFARAARRRNRLLVGPQLFRRVGRRDQQRPRHPAQVPGLSGVVAIGAGGAFSFAVKADGTVYAWGANWGSQLGDGSGLSQASPVLVPVLRNITAISGGGGGGLALKSDGTVYSWGDNIDGRVGDGTLVTRDTPVVVVGEDGEGTLEGNDWYLDLNPVIRKTIPADLVPVFLVVTQTGSGEITAKLQFRGADIGSTSSVFVFALAPPSVVRGAVAKDARFSWKARGAPKDAPIQCQLAQLNAQGQLTSVSAASLQAYASGVLSAQGQAVKVLSGVSTASIGGATFYVGYGSNGNAMLVNGTTRSVVSVPAGVSCQPQAAADGLVVQPARGWPRLLDRGARQPPLHRRVPLRRRRPRHLEFRRRHDLARRLLLHVGFPRRLGRTDAYRPYRLPGLNTLGPITLAFSDGTHGTMFWPGGATPIERQPFEPNGLTTPPQANLPESGWWWNPQESGRGFFLEWQRASWISPATCTTRPAIPRGTSRSSRLQIRSRSAATGGRSREGSRLAVSTVRPPAPATTRARWRSSSPAPPARP